MAIGETVAQVRYQDLSAKPLAALTLSEARELEHFRANGAAR